MVLQPMQENRWALVFLVALSLILETREMKDHRVVDASAIQVKEAMQVALLDSLKDELPTIDIEIKVKIF